MALATQKQKLPVCPHQTICEKFSDQQTLQDRCPLHHMPHGKAEYPCARRRVINLIQQAKTHTDVGDYAGALELFDRFFEEIGPRHTLCPPSE
jgi:hypothetical protein